MSESVIFQTDPAVIASLLFIGMVAALYLGRYLSKKFDSNIAKGKNPLKSTVIASILALFGFLLAFTFGLSGNRFDDRRKLVVEEANCIGTAILRADLYPDPVRTELRNYFKEYLAARLEFYEAGHDNVQIKSSLDKTDAYAKMLWKRVTAFSANKDMYLQSMQMVPALNSMFDIATSRNISRQETVPNSIVYFLLIISLISVFYIGYLSTEENYLNKTIVIGFCLLIALVIYITLDLDSPRKGLINLDISYQAMYDVKKMFE